MAWISRLRALFRRDKLARELDEELAFHLSMREQWNVEQGMPHAEAHRDARRRFGNPPVAGAHERDRPHDPAPDHPAGSALRRPNALPQCGLHHRRDSCPGPRHRRQHHCLHLSTKRCLPARSTLAIPARWSTSRWFANPAIPNTISAIPTTRHIEAIFIPSAA